MSVFVHGLVLDASQQSIYELLCVGADPPVSTVTWKVSALCAVGVCLDLEEFLSRTRLGERALVNGGSSA